jgi:hypothetical protein
MRPLKLPNAHFLWAGFAGPQLLLTVDDKHLTCSTRVWDLSQDANPIKLSQKEAEMAWLLFRRGGEQFLRTRGLWPDGVSRPEVAKFDAIPATFSKSGEQPWKPFAFAPDGATLLYRQVGYLAGAYRTNFRIHTPAGNKHMLYKAKGMTDGGLFDTRAAFSPDGQLVAMSSGTNLVAVWDVAKRRELLQLEQSDDVNTLAFVSNENLAVAAGRSVSLWNVEGQSLSKFRKFRKSADALAVSPDRKLFAAGSRDGLVRVWDTVTGRELKEYAWNVGSIQALSFSPDSATAAAAGISAVVVWDVD